MPRLIALASTVLLLLAVSCSQGSAPPPEPTPAPSAEGVEVDASTLDMKVMLEYRGYFGCPGDESGTRYWPGWTDGASSSMESAAVSYLPDVSDLPTGELCGTNMELLDGTAVNLFSSANRRTVDRHFQWMADCPNPPPKARRRPRWSQRQS